MWKGSTYFPWAKYMAAKDNLIWAGASMLVDKRKLIGVEGEFLPGVAAIPLPGHTNTLHGVAFIYQDKKYIVAGDAVVTKIILEMRPITMKMILSAQEKHRNS